MRTPTLRTVSYQPAQVPNDPADYPRYLREEFDRIAAAIGLLAAGHDDMIYKEPPRPRMGDRVLADGTTWNPGSGRGYYWYDSDSSTWNFLG
jgi:hypothetical protein